MLTKVTVANITALIAHQVDAAYWHEWDMFGLPGGIQLFNVLNVLIIGVVLACFVPFVRRTSSGVACSWFIAGASALVLPIHLGFALAGFEQFHLPVSIFIIIATFLLSIFQVVLTIKGLDEFGLNV